MKQSLLKSIRALSLAVLTFLGACGTHAASALSDAYREKFEQNDIVFYNPESDCVPGNSGSNVRCVPNSGGAAPDGSKITWIGDSYSEASTENIKSTFSGVDLHALYSKRFKTDGGPTTGGPSGLSILKNDVGSNLREYLVFALGTNMDATTKTAFASQITDLISTATGLNSNVKIILVSPRTRNYEYKDYTEAMQEAASANQNVLLADWNAASKDHMDEYFDGRCNYGDTGYQDNCTHPNSTGYAAWLDVIKSTLGGGSSCTAGVLAGNTIEERIWNWFVSANITGVSDNPAVIAGILGNLYVESGYNPFMVGSNGGYRGLHMLMDSYNGVEFGSALKRQVNQAVGKDAWKFYGWWSSPTTADEELTKAGLTQEQIDEALRINLEWTTTGGNKDTQMAWNNFVNGLSEVTNNSGTAGAESYAELFLGAVENAYGGGDGGGPFKDSKVQAYVSKIWGSSHTTWQGVVKRREAAVDAFNRLSNSTTGAVQTTTTAQSGGTTTTTTPASSGGFTKYQLTESEIWDLAEVGMHENDTNLNAFKAEMSIIANLYEKNKGSYSSPWDYVAHSTWFATRSYANNAHDDNVPSDHLEAVRDIFINGNRTIPTQIVEHDCFWTGSGKNDCSYGIGEAYAISDTSKSNNIMSDPGSWQSGQVLLVQWGKSGNRVEGGEWIFYDWMGGEGWKGSNGASGDPMGYFANDPPSSMPSSSSSSGGSGTNCPDSGGSNGGGNGGGSIVDAALRLAWPDKSHPDEVKPEFLEAAKALGQSTRSYCSVSSRELDYAQDCAIFVSVVVRTAGVDPDYPEGYTGSLLDHMSNSSLWEEIPNHHSEDNLQPGDVFVVHKGAGGSGHTFIYIGNGQIASASLCSYTGQIQNVYFSDSRGDYHIFRSTVQSSGGGSTGSFDADLKKLESGSTKVGAAVSAIGNKDSSSVQVGGSWSGGRAWSTIKVPLAIAALQKNISTTSYKDTYTGCNSSPSSLNLSSAVQAAITKSDNCGAWWLWEGLGGNDSSAASAVTDVIKSGGDSSTTVNGTGKSTGFLTSGYTNWSLAGQALFAANMASLSNTNTVMTHMDNQSGGDSSYGLNRIGTKNLSKGGWGDDSSTSATRQFGIVKWSDGQCSAIAIGTNAGSNFGLLNDIADVLSTHQGDLPKGNCPSGV